MTTARKPPTPPEPRHVNRPLAQPEARPGDKDIPRTIEVRNRLRKAIHDSNGELTVRAIAEEIGMNRAQLSEFLGAGFRSKPSSERFAEMIVWLVLHDDKFAGEFFVKKFKKTPFVQIR